MTKDRDYEVGYGRPPKEHQFKPGHSRNSKGRPKGARGLRADVEEVLNMPVTISGKRGPKKISTQKALILRLREIGLKGDLKALERLLTLGVQHVPQERSSEEGRLPEADQAIIAEFMSRVQGRGGGNV